MSDRALFYYRTTRAAAKAILLVGFRDGMGVHPAGSEPSGVRLVDYRPEPDGSARGDAVLEVSFDAELARAFTASERVDDGQPYREFVVPAELINRYAKVRVAPPRNV